MPRHVRPVHSPVPHDGASRSGRKSSLPGRSGRVAFSLVAVTLVLALLVSTPTALAFTFKSWTPPYKGTSFTSHRMAIAGGCQESVSHSTPAFNLSTGAVSSGAAVDASACNKSKFSGSSASAEAKAGVALASFVSKGGKYVGKVHWSVDFRISLDLTGATCSDSGQAALVDVEFAAYFLNVTAGGKLILGASFVIDHSINTTGSSSWTTNVQHNLTWGATLGTNDTYEIATGVGYAAAVSVNNGGSNDPDACAATADLTRSGGSAFATLDGVVLFHY